MIPDRISSLCLTSTAPRLVNTIGFIENLRNRVNLFIPRPLDQQVANVERNLYSIDWLKKPDELEYTVKPFPTNADRFAAAEISKRLDPNLYGKKGFMAQALAAGWHAKSAEQLKKLGDDVGRGRICVIHGTNDRMITFPHAEILLSELGGEESGVTKWFLEGQGHVIPIEMRNAFHNKVVEMVEKGRKLNA